MSSPRPLTGADIRLLMDRALWGAARFGDATLKAAHAVQWLSDANARDRKACFGTKRRAEQATRAIAKGGVAAGLRESA